MKILLPFKVRKTGGTSTFARNFHREMEKRGHHITYKFDPSYDVLLASPRAPLSLLIHAKIHHKPIIHRLDGVYYRSTVAGRLYHLHNIPLRVIRNYFADHVIYQSRFSKECCDTFLGKTHNTVPYRIIYNGVDTKLFTPHGSANDLRDTNEQTIFITASRFRREDQIIPLLQAFVLYQQKFNSNSKLYVIGDFIDPLPRDPRILLSGVSLKKNNTIQFVGPIHNEKLPPYYRGADVFVCTHRNPPCPNNVLEAMACGLPICGISDGAMPELVRDGVDGKLLPVRAATFKNERSVDVHGFAQNMHIVAQTKRTYADFDRTHNVGRMVDEYVDVFTRATNTYD